MNKKWKFEEPRQSPSGIRELFGYFLAVQKVSDVLRLLFATALKENVFYKKKIIKKDQVFIIEKKGK